MRFPREQRRLEAGVVVTGGAFRARDPLCELAFVNVLVAIFTMFVRHRPAKIAVFVTLRAHCLIMFAMQRKLRVVVIEICARQILVPSRRVVASLARALKLGVLEGALVRIGVAVLAAAGGKTLVARNLLVRLRPVTRLARHCLMLAGQRKRSPAVIETRSRLPGIRGVAAKTICSQLSRMGILVARCALFLQTKKCMIQILDLDLRARLGRNALCRVARLALLLFVFAF